MEEFKHCPFCGSKHILFREQVGTYEVYCQDCDANVGIHKTFEEAVKAWNRREEPKPTMNEALEAKKEKCLRILIAELHSMEDVFRRPFLVGDPGLAKSHVEQAAYDLGEVMFELAQIEKEENQ